MLTSRFHKCATSIVAAFIAVGALQTPAAAKTDDGSDVLRFDPSTYLLDDLSGYVGDAEPVYFTETSAGPISVSPSGLGIDPAGPNTAPPAGVSEDALPDKFSPRVSSPTFSDCGFVPDVWGDGTYSRGISPVQCRYYKAVLHAGTTLSRKRWYGYQFLDSDESTNDESTYVTSVSRWKCRGTGTYTYYVDANGDATDFQGRTYYGQGGDKARFHC